MSKLRCHISISLDGFVAGPKSLPSVIPFILPRERLGQVDPVIPMVHDSHAQSAFPFHPVPVSALQP
jgi:hypothetical protein